MENEVRVVGKVFESEGNAMDFLFERGIIDKMDIFHIQQFSLEHYLQRKEGLPSPMDLESGFVVGYHIEHDEELEISYRSWERLFGEKPNFINVYEGDQLIIWEN